MGAVMRYSVAAEPAPTAATINHCNGALWNPHATKDITVLGVAWSKVMGITTGQYAQRISARGTPGSTVTPDIDNDFERLLAPISGALLDLAAYTVQPTLAGPDFFRFATSQNNPGPTHELWFPGGLRIPAGTGLGIFQGSSATSQGDITFVWDE